MLKLKKWISVLLVACMVLGMLPAMTVWAADEGGFMEIAGSGNSRYLSTIGSNAFNVFMYDNTFSGTFGDQHMGGIEFSLNGLRIATNGDIHYLPTPEQWDATPAPSRGTKTYDTATNTITVPMTFNGSPDGTLRYNLVASPTSEGVKLQVILTTAMPEDLKGKARFNLEFLPLAYRNKTYQADLNGDGVYDDFGTFPLHPKDEMVDTERPDLPSQAWYVKDWNEDRGDAQPLPFAKGYGFVFSPEDEDTAITITASAGSELELFDGRNRAQNGWFVLSSLITDGGAGDVVAEWLIKPSVKEGWVRQPNVGFSQVGYSPLQEKFAVVELDKYDEDYPKTISLLQVNADGSRKEVLTKELGTPTPWLRYKDVRFDFTEVTETGLYQIKYGDQLSEVFPIAKDVYDGIWQDALDGFLTVAMDHMEVREGYKIWHGAAHMDDGTIGDRSSSWFDGMSMQTMPQAIRDKGYKGEDHLKGINKGGWYDAGDFDLQISRNVGVWGTLVNTAEATNNLDNFDELTVTWDDETGGSAEMHRPDGIPDIVQHAVHGAKQILAEYEELGGVGGTMEVRSLRQYTHLGDPSSDTDGYIYDSTLAEDEIVERDGKIYSGRPDDRYFLTAGGGGSFQAGIGNHYINFAATAYLAVPYEETQDYAKHLFEVALTQAGNASNNWNALVQFTLAAKAFKEAGVDYAGSDTYSYEYFKNLFDQQVGSHLSASSNINILACKDLLTDEQWAQVGASVKSSADGQTASTEVYGLRPYQGASWGNSVGAYSGQTNNALMYYNFPEEGEGFKQNLLRSVNYVLGRHPNTNASYISGVGTKSALHPYNSNRGDESFIPGSILPGHITFSDYAESLDDFSFLWFENESIINYQSSWLAVGLAASKMAQNEKAEEKPAPTKDFESNLDAKLVTKTTSSGWGGASTDGYLADKGFNVLMYSTTFDRTFGDQHCAGIELIQNGRRVATNGDIHLLPTPEQWDATPPPTRGQRTFDAETGKITVNMTLPAEILAIDTSALEAAIAEAEKIDADKYTEESINALNTALQRAKTTLETAKAATDSTTFSTQQTNVNNAANTLNNAIAALVLKEGELDKAPLEKAIEDAEKLDADKYTEESAKALAEAIEAAKKALEEAKTQDELDAAKKALDDAIAALVEKTEPTPTPTPGEHDCPGKNFTDMPAVDYWSHAPIDWAIVNKITVGTSDTTFGPTEGCTRAQVVTFLWRAAKEPAPTSKENPFKDVKESDYFYNAVLWAVEKGITVGTEADKFSPGETCTRAQIVTFLYRYEGKPEVKPDDSFTDVKPGDYFADSVAWAVANGITKGTDPGKFSPYDTCTREQVVTFLYRDIAGEKAVMTGADEEETPANNPAVNYQLIAEPEEGGIKLTVKLDEKLPEDLIGKAGFNLEFLPAVYIGKSFQTDTDGDGTYDKFGVFPLVPSDEMEEVSRSRTANQVWYVQEWNEDRGDYQPLPFAEGKKMTFASEDDDYRIRIEAEDGLALYDGRNRAQNGWFVLRTLIPADKTEIVWHISPDTKENWTREPNIAHSQVGYEPELDKVAVIELDANFKGGDTAYLKKLGADGTYETVKEITLGEAKTWQRYVYRDCDFSDVKARGTYVIDYEGTISDPFPIQPGVYADIWQTSLGGYMAIQMDHMKIREGYKIWRNPAHMDDALQAPASGVSWFDGWSTSATSQSPYKDYEHIPGLNEGGFSDAGDFDIQTGANLGVISNLALAYQVYGSDYDTLAIDWDLHDVELHRPDGVPDLVQLVKHGALQFLGQYENIGFLASVLEVPSLRQYTHLGDGAKDTDGRVYDPTLGEDEVNGLRSGKRDDRLAFAFSKSVSNNLSAAADFAMAAGVAKKYDPEYDTEFVERALTDAEKIWNEEPDTHKGIETESTFWGMTIKSGPQDWNLAIELFYATGKDVYKNRILECLDYELGTESTGGGGFFGGGGAPFASGGWRVFKVIDKLGDEAKAKFDAALEKYIPTLNAAYTGSNPFGVSDTMGMWGGAGGVASSQTTAAILHKYLKDANKDVENYVNPIKLDRYFNAINYILGTHPCNSTSWITNVGAKSVTTGYGSNRAERYYIAGGLVPGYVTIAPDFPEHMDDFNFLWFENEYTVEVTSGWILAAMGADEFAREKDVPCEHNWQEKVTEPTCTKDGYTTRFCNKCFVSEVINPVPALGHDYDEGVITKQPTAMFDGIKTFTCKRCGVTYTEKIPATGGAVEIPDFIDFTKTEDKVKYSILGQDESDVIEGEGLPLYCRLGGIEPAKRNVEEANKDVVMLPVSGDWTATLEFKFNANGGRGAYAFFGFYAIENDDWQNMVGIRGGDGAMQDFIRKNGNVTEELKSSAPGMSVEDGTYWYRIKKEGTTYICFRSEDGETFKEMFRFEDCGIEARGIVIDAYTGMSEGYKLTLKNLKFTDVVNNGPAATIIDFTSEADLTAGKYEIKGLQEGTAITEDGLKLVCNQGGVEPAKRNIAEVEKDVVVVPVSGNWTATLNFKYDPAGGGGAWAFFGFYAAQGDDYQNMLGIRGGDGAFQNFERHEGVITHEDEADVNSSPGFSAAAEYFWQITKAGTKYTCFRSDDNGETWTEMFSYTADDIDATKLVIDAYTGRDEGRSFTLEKLVVENQ